MVAIYSVDHLLNLLRRPLHSFCTTRVVDLRNPVTCIACLAQDLVCVRQGAPFIVKLRRRCVRICVEALDVDCVCVAYPKWLPACGAGFPFISCVAFQTIYAEPVPCKGSKQSAARLAGYVHSSRTAGKKAEELQEMVFLTDTTV